MAGSYLGQGGLRRKLGPAIEVLAPRTNPPSGIEMWQMLNQAIRDGMFLSQLRLPQTHENRLRSPVALRGICPRQLAAV
jgi:hypothetical protein